MAVTETDIQSFVEFARRESARNGNHLTMGQLALKWEADRETADIVAAVEDGEAEFAAGGGRPAAEVIAEIREKLSAR